jgi:hypothetical protein
MADEEKPFRSGFSRLGLDRTRLIPEHPVGEHRGDLLRQTNEPGLPTVKDQPVNPDRSFLFIHGFINSALYIVGVFVAGMVWDHHVAVIGSVITAALCYLAALVQLSVPEARLSATILVALSIAAGFVAGLGLL